MGGIGTWFGRGLWKRTFAAVPTVYVPGHFIFVQIKQYFLSNFMSQCDKHNLGNTRSSLFYLATQWVFHKIN